MLAKLANLVKITDGGDTRAQSAGALWNFFMIRCMCRILHFLFLWFHSLIGHIVNSFVTAILLKIMCICYCTIYLSWPLGGYTLSLSTSISDVSFSSIFAPRKILKHMKKWNHGWWLNMSVIGAMERQTRVKWTKIVYPYVYLMVLTGILVFGQSSL
jgi:hypothetical protein